MNHPDRLTAPTLRTPGKTHVAHAELITLDNGMRLYAVNAGVQDVVRLEIIFPTSAADASQYLPSLAAHYLIDSGTAKRSAMQIATGFDFFGAHLETDMHADWKTITLFSLSRLLPETLPLLKELLEEAVYPEQETGNWRTRQLQQLRVQQAKVSWLARTTFNSEIFGNSHLYGYSMTENDLTLLTDDQIKNAYRTGYQPSNAIVVLSGKFEPSTISEINRILGAVHSDVPVAAQHPSLLAPQMEHTGIKRIKVEKPDAVQSCIRIGKRLFPKSHEDFIELSVVSTILGGYFGSRLMANIREDKGYTYGIGSALVPHLYSGAFFISTEVGTDVCAPALTEIYNELEKLATLPVSEEELGLVRNYLIGSFQRSVDGPFGLADRFKGLKLHNLDYQYLEKYQEVIHNIDASTVMELTKKWLSPDSMTEVVAG